MNNQLLDEKVKENGRKYNFIARQIGITEFGLIKKRKGIIPWKINEINTITELLNLTEDERDDIFGLKGTQK